MHILVTGATRGIGRALVTEFNTAGHLATGTCRGKPPVTGRWLSMDVTDPRSIQNAAHDWGSTSLDLLVCNAGVLMDRNEKLDTGYPASMWADMLDVNVTGVFLTIQAFLPALRRAKDAKIAIISSHMGSSTHAPGHSLIYRASKAAALNLGRNLAAELLPEGIPVGIYHPGWVKTDMGGSGADVPAETSARGLAERFAALSLATTGCFENYDGRRLDF